MTSLTASGSAALHILTSDNGTVDGETMPASLPEHGLAAEKLWPLLKELTVGDGEDDVAPQLSPAAEQTLVAHTCAAYVASMEPTAQARVTSQLTNQLTDWLSDLFSQSYTSLHLHTNPSEGFSSMVRLTLHSKYPTYATTGYEALYARPPVIYVSAACPTSLVAQLMTSQGLPGSTIRVVALSSTFGSAHAMDVAQLERMLEEDESAQKVPIAVLAHAGTPELGHVDNLPRVAEICRQHGVWCHVTGASLAALALIGSAVNQPGRPVLLGDSVTLDLGQWLGQASLPAATLYSCDLALPPGALPAPPTALQTLPLWTSLMSMGRAGLVERIRAAFALISAVEVRVVAVPKLQILSARPGRELNQPADLIKLVSKPLNEMVVLESLSPCVVFRYTNEEVDDPLYLDNLNSWLGQIMQRDLPELPIQVLDVDGRGFCLRFSPLIDQYHPLGQDALDEWAECLQQQIEILNATVHHKRRFAELTKSGPLRLVNLTNWAGLGAVRYIPAHLQPNMEAGVTDSGKEDINKLNTELLAKLKSTDSAFSLGDSEDGMVCIRFGMVTMDTDVDELFRLLVELGNEIEESSRFIETMTEIVMKGIETASEDLRKESEDQLWQEGVLRHVPLVGTFVNWWSPPAKQGVKGRKLDLSEGIVESTEETYKSRAQQTRRTSSSASISTSTSTGTGTGTGQTNPQHSRTSSTASKTAGSAPVSEAPPPPAPDSAQQAPPTGPQAPPTAQQA